MSKETSGEKLYAELDKGLLKMLKKGTTVLDPKTGKPVKIDAPHQVWEIARKRIKDLDLSGEAKKDSDQAKLAAELNAREEREKKDVLEMTDVPDFDNPDVPDVVAG